MSAQIRYTGGTWSVTVEGEVVSDGHLQHKEALEKATNLVLSGAVDVEVHHSATRVTVEGASQPPEEQPPEDEEDPTGDPPEDDPEPQPDPDPVEPATVDSPFVQFAEGEEEERDGATWEYYNRGANLPWERKGGDWTDKDGSRHGAIPFASHTYGGGDSGTVEIDVSLLVKGWIEGDYINQGLMLRGVGGGTLRFGSRTNPDETLRPSLVIDGTEYAPDADTALTDSTDYSVGHGDNLSLSSDNPLLMRWSLPESATSAVLRLQVVKSFSAHGIDIQVYRCTPPAFTEGTPETGIAAEGLNGHPSVLYRNPFNDPDTWQEGLGGSWRGNEVIEDGRLKLTLIPGGGGGLNVHYNFENNGQEQPEECYARYELEISGQWEPTQGGKLPGFAGLGSRGSGGGTPDGTNGWSNRGRYWLKPPPSNPLHDYIRIGNYTYHVNQSGHYGDPRTWRRHAAGFLLQDQKYTIETYVKLNTPGVADGIVRGWVDGIPAYERTDLLFRTVEDLKIKTFWLNVFHGGLGDPAADSICYLSNLVIASEYIGPQDETQQDPEEEPPEQEEPPNEGPAPLPDDATTTDILSNLNSGEGSLLPDFAVQGVALDAHGTFAERGPGRRDYCNKWVFAPDRKQAMYCGGNHGAPHKFNDVWSFDLPANTWTMLYAPDEGVSTLHTWWAMDYDPVRGELLWMATRGTWPLSDSVTPPLVAWNGSWEAVETTPGFDAVPGGAMSYIPGRDILLCLNNNWNGSGLWQIDRSTGEASERLGLDGTYYSSPDSPGRETVFNYDEANDLWVGFLGDTVYAYSIAENRFLPRREGVLPFSAHDAGTASDYANGVHWLHDEDRLFTYDYATDTLTEHTVPQLGGCMGYFDPEYGVFVLYNEANPTQVYVHKA